MPRRKSFLFVRLKEATEERYVFISKAPRILTLILLIPLIDLIFIAVSFGTAKGGGWSTGQLAALAAACLLLVGVILLVPFTEIFIFNKPRKYFIWRRETLANKLKISEPDEKFYSLRELRFSWQMLPRTNPLTITRIDNQQFVLNFSIKKEQLEEFRTWLVGPRVEEEQPEEEIVPLSNEEKTSMQYQSMLKEIRSWGWSLLVLGGVHLVSFGFFNPSWGVTLILVGLFSFVFKNAAIFILYAVTLVWVGLNNIVYTVVSYWTFFGFLQIYWGYGLYKKFRQYQEVEKEHHSSTVNVIGEEESTPNRAAKFFPGLGCAMSAIGLAGYVGLFVFMIYLMAIQPPGGGQPEVSSTAEFIIELLIGFGGLGFGVSLAALLSNFKPKWLAWVGVIVGGAVVLLEYVLIFLS